MTKRFLIFTAALALGDSAFGSLADLRSALTLHASFDEGLKADFTRGDKNLYSYATVAERDSGGSVAELSEGVSIEQGSGRYGGSLLRDVASKVQLFYKNKGILDYDRKAWSRTISVWLRTSPDIDLPPSYCDPILIREGKMDDGFIFVEWSRDHNPRKFRYAILPRVSQWNPDGAVWDEIPNEKRPMVEVSRAPFSRAKWTHVVFTVSDVNTDDGPGGSLYVDGVLQGRIEGWDLDLDWNGEQVKLLIGASYIGHIDDLSVFDRALSDDEVALLHNLNGGVSSLYE